jgi:hypothetical protein
MRREHLPTEPFTVEAVGDDGGMKTSQAGDERQVTVGHCLAPLATMVSAMLAA